MIDINLLKTNEIVLIGKLNRHAKIKLRHVWLIENCMAMLTATAKEVGERRPMGYRLSL